MFLERKQDMKKDNKYKACKWCYKSYKESDKDDHRICNNKYKKTLRSRKQNLELVNSRVNKFSSPIHNQNRYLSEAKNLEILVAYYEMGWLKRDPRIEY
jgi:protein-arginine kinase activator protein McsA